MAIKVWTGASSDNDFSNAANWTSTGLPGAADTVIIPAGSPSIIAGLAFSSVAIDEFIVEEGYTGEIGTSTNNVHTYLTIDPDSVRFAGTGKARINVGSNSVNVEVLDTGVAGTGDFGLYLRGTDLNEVNVRGGTVGIGAVSDSSDIVDALNVLGPTADVTIGRACSCTGIAIKQLDGSLTLENGSTLATVSVYGGTFTHEGLDQLLSVYVYGGVANLNAGANIKNIYAYGGETNAVAGGSTRTYAAVQYRPGAAFAFNPDLVGITAWTAPEAPVRLTVTQP